MLKKIKMIKLFLMLFMFFCGTEKIFAAFTCPTGWKYLNDANIGGEICYTDINSDINLKTNPQPNPQTWCWSKTKIQTAFQSVGYTCGEVAIFTPEQGSQKPPLCYILISSCKKASNAQTSSNSNNSPVVSTDPPTEENDTSSMRPSNDINPATGNTLVYIVLVLGILSFCGLIYYYKFGNKL